MCARARSTLGDRLVNANRVSGSKHGTNDQIWQQTTDRPACGTAFAVARLLTYRRILLDDKIFSVVGGTQHVVETVVLQSVRRDNSINSRG